MEEWIKDLNFVLMPCRHAVKGYESHYQAAYECWRAAWEKFRGEIGVTEPLNCDGFIMPDEMGVMFYKGECVGLASFTHGRLDQGPMKDHSWFKAWTPEAYKKLQNISQDGIICSQFTINPKFAGKNQVVRWKEILFNYVHMRFDFSNAGVMAGHLNLTRGMQNACGEEFGGTILDPLHPFNYYGVSLNAQLVAYQREIIHRMIERKNIHSLCQNLWSKLTHLTEFPVVRPVIPLKKTA